ncbi:antibiotic biosynthesis monooxygenase [Streptomyces glaucescens]|uniref:antibiotic biosynthesis monooxygenase n=1 Tax=Streptomyces glaucescens TaxID=1907 RepID=UPI000A3CE45E|nr:antibiotic biosynthesis monooxygenase [Streptomyces glaucescens]
MITEIAQIKIHSGHEKQFESAVAEAVSLFLSDDGCHGILVHAATDRGAQAVS